MNQLVDSKSAILTQSVGGKVADPAEDGLMSDSAGAVGGANGPSASVGVGASVSVETDSALTGTEPGRSLACPDEQATNTADAISTRKATHRV